MQRVFLVGARASGKSTIGRSLEVAGVVKSREPLYREASHHCVSTDQPVKNIVREISQKLHKDIS